MHTDTRARRGMRALVLVTATTLALGVDGARRRARERGKTPKPPTVAQLGASWMANQITANGGFLKSFGSSRPARTPRTR